MKIHSFHSFHQGEQTIHKALINKLLDESYDDDYDNDYDLSAGDRWLKKYTNQGMDKWPGKDTIADLMDKYSNDKDMTIYRGMNFETQEEFDEFMKSIKGGKLKTGGISSWSPDKGTAWQFSVTRPTYYLNMELMRAEDKKNKEREYMIGYRGVILKCDIKKGQGINVNKSKFGAESEVILPSGEYDVTIEEIKPFKELVKENDPSKVVLDLTRKDIKEDSFNAQFFKYIVFNSMELSKESKEHLFKMFMPTVKPTVSIKKQDGNRYTDDATIINIGFSDDSLPYMMYTYAKVIGDKYAPDLHKLADQILTTVIKELQKNDDFENTEVGGNISYWSSFFKDYGDTKLINKYKNIVQGRLGKAYRKLSDDDSAMSSRVRDINKITDPKAKSDAIDKYANDIKMLLGNIMKMA